MLAACETGLGQVANGEGVFGLQRAFLVAGADNVLISLVKIDDQAARNFMNLFYEQLLDVEDPQLAFFNARNDSLVLLKIFFVVGAVRCDATNLRQTQQLLR